MKRKIYRNIAIVSAIFAISFSVMLTTNYFQVRKSTPLQAEVLETLKTLNYQDAGNVELQEQIRLLDLQARRAYFATQASLKMGIYILIGMLAVMLIMLRLYYAEYRNIPDKEIDPIDEWAIKSKARNYVLGGVMTLAVVSLLLAFGSAPFLKSATEEVVEMELAAEEDTTPKAEEETAPILEEEEEPEQMAEVEKAEPAVEVKEKTAVAEAPKEEAPKAKVPASKPSHGGFRGNFGDGKSSAQKLPTSWDLAAGTNIAWKINTPRSGYNSPVISGGKVFFSGADEEARELFCYDLASGKQLWKLAAIGIAGSPAVMPNTTEDTGLAASTVATNGTQVCAIFATGDMICADMEGKQLWAKNLGVPENNYGYASSLLAFEGAVIVQYDNHNIKKIAAFDFVSGKEIWSNERSEIETWSSPSIAMVGGKPQLVVMGNPNLKAYNPNTGEELWSVNAFSGEVGASACSASGVIFGASEYAKIVAVNGTDGSVLWEQNEYMPDVSSPVATSDNLYVATSYGVIVAYDAKTGAIRKERDLGNGFYSSPMIADGKIYAADTDGKVYIFSADDEFEVLASIETGEKTYATPAFAEGKIVWRTNKSIYCVSEGK
ncbi:MAG: PQQ-binding-like beta-propeller repeat protein [Mangrovibacterium sp.]